MGKRTSIPQPEYEALVLQSKQKTLIGDKGKIFGDIDIKKRIADLEALEQSKGFVFVAEKLWLLDVLSEKFDGGHFHYHKWLEKKLFETYPKSLSFSEFEPEIDYYPNKAWKLAIDSKPAQLNFSCFEHRGLNYPDSLDVFIYGSQKGFSPAHLVTAYEYMHDLEYMMELHNQDPSPYQKNDIMNIAVVSAENPYRWTINLMSEYGSEWDTYFNFRTYGR